MTTQIHKVNGHELCRVHVLPCVFPVEATVVIDKKGNLEKKQAFFVRLNNRTREIVDAGERGKYILSRWDPAQPPASVGPLGVAAHRSSDRILIGGTARSAIARTFLHEDVWRATR